MILDVYKPIGKTNGEIINEIKQNNPDIKKICFAGRLDPLAHGYLKILTDDDIYQQDLFCNKDKIYSTNLILNWTTDSYDILGFPTYQKINDLHSITSHINNMINTDIKQKYPPYSSMTIKKYNKPFWQVSKENLQLDDHDIPTKNIKIYDIKINNIDYITSNELYQIIDNRINLINPINDFRQTSILYIWKSKLDNFIDNITIISITVKASSGTYIRSIANTLNSCCFDINRLAYLN